MEDINKNAQEYEQAENEQAAFSLQDIIKVFVLNWKWFVLSIVACVALCFVYLKYTTPTYQMDAKLLIKDDPNGPRRSRMSGMMQMEALGMMVNSYGTENEIEILNSNILARQIVENLKLYVSYKSVGKLKDGILYKNQPITVDMDKQHLDRLNVPMNLKIERKNGKYLVEGTYCIPYDVMSSSEPYEINDSFDKLPAQLGTGAGIVYFTKNKDLELKEGEAMKVTLMSPQNASYGYQARPSSSELQP